MGQSEVTGSNSRRVVFIIGSSASSKGGDSSSRAVVPRPGSNGDLQGVLQDCSRVYDFAMKCGWHVRHFICSLEGTSKQHVLRELHIMATEEYLSQKLVYYSGHGNLEGGWVFNNGFISPEDFMQACFTVPLNGYKNNPQPGKWVVVSDSCYAGNWSKLMEPKKYCESSAQEFDQNIHQKLWVHCFLACEKNQTAVEERQQSYYGGRYTKKWLESATKENLKGSFEDSTKLLLGWPGPKCENLGDGQKNYYCSAVVNPLQQIYNYY